MAISQDNADITISAAGADAVEIAIMAKAPIAGYAKTRLIPLLGPAGAADLQAWLLQKTMTTALGAGIGPISLWCAPDCTHPAFARYGEHGRVNRYRQPEGDLGARMLAAVERPPGGLGTLIIGTDCPTLGVTEIRSTFQAIRDGYDAAIIPAEDGGYVALAMRKPFRALFRDIEWSTSGVLAQTRLRALEAGIRLLELPPMPDVDLPSDFFRISSQFPELQQIFRLRSGNFTASEDACP